MLFLLAFIGIAAAQVCAPVCQNGGNCVNNTGVIECQCVGGYGGNDCSVVPAGTWGEWAPCNKLCGFGEETRPCTPTGATCADDSLGGASKPCVEFECKNCSFHYGGWSTCTKTCGTGTSQRSNNINEPGTPGAIIPCPPLEEERECNTQMCRAVINGIGYWYWELKGPAMFTYTIGSLTGRAVDVFLFKGTESWSAYRRDVARNKYPYNYGYTPTLANYDTENSKGVVPLEAGESYFFVVDYSYVGAAKERDDEWRVMHFTHALGGGDWGPGKSLATRAMVSPFALLAALFTLVKLM